MKVCGEMLNAYKARLMGQLSRLLRSLRTRGAFAPSKNVLGCSQKPVQADSRASFSRPSFMSSLRRRSASSTPSNELRGPSF
jgi:hypothetical protein